MDHSQIISLWQQKYKTAAAQIEKTAELKFVATAFNSNIDAVLKISGSEITGLANDVALEYENIEQGENKLNSPHNVVRGIVKCFQHGIAEEWLAEDAAVYEWMQKNLGYDRLQMGGQAGIIANVLALTGIKNVLVHTASHPRLQAEQFLHIPNLKAVGDDGKLHIAYETNRQNDIPLVHWIIEFDKGDECVIGNKTIVCPKSNRFIATYDPLNSKMHINNYFMNELKQNNFDCLLLSGYHMLQGKSGIEAVKNSAREIQKLKKTNPQGIIHLEIASTQDKAVRSEILNQIAVQSDSLGLNERETLDILELLSPQDFKVLNTAELHSPQLFDALCKIKEYTKAPRIQLHMFGLYVTIQNKKPLIGSNESISGMLAAATAAASKAYLSKLEKKSDLCYAAENHVGNICLSELQKLSDYLNSPELLSSGICNFHNYTVTAIPTIIVEKPKTLVGMGDTISSLSLLCAR